MHQRYMEQFVKQTYFEFVTTSVLIWSYMYICDMRFNCCNLLGNLLKSEDLDYNIGYACKRNKKKLMYLLVVMFLFAVSFCVFPISYFIYINPDSKHKKTTVSILAMFDCWYDIPERYNGVDSMKIDNSDVFCTCRLRNISLQKYELFAIQLFFHADLNLVSFNLHLFTSRDNSKKKICDVIFGYHFCTLVFSRVLTRILVFEFSLYELSWMKPRALGSKLDIHRHRMAW